MVHYLGRIATSQLYTSCRCRQRFNIQHVSFRYLWWWFDGAHVKVPKIKLKACSCSVLLQTFSFHIKLCSSGKLSWAPRLVAGTSGQNLRYQAVMRDVLWELLHCESETIKHCESCCTVRAPLALWECHILFSTPNAIHGRHAGISMFNFCQLGSTWQVKTLWVTPGLAHLAIKKFSAPLCAKPCQRPVLRLMAHSFTALIGGMLMPFFITTSGRTGIKPLTCQLTHQTMPHRHLDQTWAPKSAATSVPVWPGTTLVASGMKLTSIFFTSFHASGFSGSGVSTKSW